MGCVRWKVLELDSGSNLDRSRRTYAAGPSAKTIATTSRYVIDKGETRALVVNVSGRIKVMLVKRVEEGKAKLKIPALANPCVFGKRDIHILPVRTSDVCDAWSISGEPVGSSAPRSSTGYAERSQWFEGGTVEQGPFPRIVTVYILQKWVDTRNEPNQSILPELRHYLATRRTEPHGRAALQVNQRTELPPADKCIDGAASVRVTLPFAERQIVNKCCG